MTESEVMLVVVAAAVVFLGTVLSLFACCKVAGDCSREEEKKEARPEVVLTRDNRCVFCGEIIPEGRMVCPNCEREN